MIPKIIAGMFRCELLGFQWDVRAWRFFSLRSWMRNTEETRLSCAKRFSCELIQHSASPKWGICKLENTASSMGLSEVVCLLEPIYPALHRWRRLPQRPGLQVFPTAWKWEMNIWASSLLRHRIQPLSPNSKVDQRISWALFKQMNVCFFVESYELDKESGNAFPYLGSFPLLP